METTVKLIVFLLANAFQRELNVSQVYSVKNYNVPRN